MPPPERKFSTLLSDLSPNVVGSASMGGAREMVPPEEQASNLHSALAVLTDFLPTDFEHITHPEPPPPEPPPLPGQFGPFDFNPIVFDDGVPVGGWTQLTLFRNGAVNFSGHFHVSGAPSYDTTAVFAVRGGDGIVFTFSHTGRVHGTFEAGSRDDNWGDTRPANDSIAASWPSLADSLTWRANAAVNVDLGVFLDATVKTVGAVAAVIAII